MTFRYGPLMDRPAQRIVSLCPSITETVDALGAWDRLVGRTRYCVHPADRVGQVTDVGGTKAPKIEEIVELKPDLVLLNEEENRIEDAQLLTAAGLRVESFLPRDLPTTAEYIQRLGVLLSCEEEAQTLTRQLEEAVSLFDRERDPEWSPSFLYLIWRKPWMGVRSGTFISSMLEQGSFRNLLTPVRSGAGAPSEDGGDYPELTGDDMRRLDPSFVFLSSEPFPFKEDHISELVESTGLSRDRFVLVDGELLSWHGVRTIAGLGYVRQLTSELKAGADASTPAQD